MYNFFFSFFLLCFSLSYEVIKNIIQKLLASSLYLLLLFASIKLTTVCF